MRASSSTMANAIVKQFMAYSLLVVGYLVVQRYIKVTSDGPAPPSSSSVDDIATAIIELVENMEYQHYHASHIPATDEEAVEEATAWMTKAEEDLRALMHKYVRESRLDLTGEEVLKVTDRRGRQVRLSLSEGVEEFPDEIGYKEQEEVLKNTNWDTKKDEV